MLNSYKVLLKSTPLKQRKNVNVTVGLSGGVDSATTAYLLKKDGFNVKAVFMMCFDDGTPNCSSLQDKSDAIRVASNLDIPIEIWNFEKEYKQFVLDYFLDGYKKGLTPNPDILCNSEIKFKFFLEKALKTGADYVATGHYAKIIENIPINPARIASQSDAGGQYTNTINEKIPDSRFQITNSYYLSIPKDKGKDQTYFLSDVPNSKFEKVLFPLGDYLKSEVREIAKNAKIPVAEKKDSTGICFLEGIKMQDFLKKNIESKIGLIKTLKGEIVGEHTGIWFYTIGQRHGFNVTKYTGKPMYIIEKNIDKNELVVGEKADLLKTTINVNGLPVPFATLIPDSRFQIANSDNLFVRIRNLGKLIEIKEINGYAITLKQPIDSVAAGQFAVVYKRVKSNYLLVSKGEIT